MSQPSRSEWIYARLLRLYPAEFRDRFADSMRYSFAADARAARERGIAAFAWFWARSTAHVLVLALAERLGRRDGPSWRDGLGTDLVHAIRRLRRSPGFTAVAVITLALGLGATTAISSLVHGVLLDPLPYPEADRLVSVRHSAEGAGIPSMGISLGTYVHYREHQRAFEELALYTVTQFALLGDAGARRVPGALVSTDFFDIFLDGPPALGRTLSDADQRPDAARVAVISHDLWQGREGGDPGVVGSSLVVDGIEVQVVGVLPPGFDVPYRDTQVWVPHRIDPDEVILGGFGRGGVGRLRPGTTPDQAQAELQRLIPSLADRFNPVAFDLIVTGGRLQAQVRPLREAVVGNVEQMLWILLATALFVLALACANVTNLFLVRAESQQREIAVRASLGAGRLHIVRHHLAEGLALGLLSGGLGVLLALLGVRWVVAWGPRALPRLHEVELDAPVLTLAAGLSLLAALLCAAVPLLRAGSANLATSMADGGRGATAGREQHRTRNGLVVVQVSLALVLSIGAGLMVRTFWHLQGVDPGFDTSSSLVFRVGLPEALYPDATEAMQFQQRVRERLAELPGAVAVGATRCLPLDGCDGSTPVYADDRPVEPGQTPPSVDVRGATAGFFEAMGIPLLEGRTFEPADAGRRPAAAIVSRNLAERMWPGESAVGKRIHPDYPSEEEAPYTVVGVVGDVVAYGLADEPPEILWLSFLGPYGYAAPPQSLTFVVHSDVPPLSLAPSVRGALRELDPDVPLSDLRTLQQVLHAASAPAAFAMTLLVVAGCAALALGAVGIYGMLSYVVSQRTDEIGVRMALGARASGVGAMVLRQGAVLVVLGLIVGVAAAVTLTRLMGAVLFGVSPLDPLTYTVVVVGLTLVALIAGYLPARRAAAVDPVDALRSG